LEGDKLTTLWVCFHVFAPQQLIWSNYGKRVSMFTSLFLNSFESTHT
jgi:hypothetical protein